MRPLLTAVTAWRAGRAGRGTLPTTPAGVEVCAAAVFLGVRVVGLAQLGLALPTAARHATRPAVFAAVLACYLAESAAIGVAVVRARGYRDPRWGALDTAVAAGVLLGQPLFTAAEDSTGSWTAWGFALTLGSAAGAAVVFARAWQAAAAVAVLVVCYLAASLTAVGPGAMRSTVVSNAFAYLGFAVLTRLLAGYLRRLAADAASARSAAASAAAEAARLREVERQRTLLHDNISVLRLLARPDLPPELAEPMRAQAVALANRVRTFLDDNRRPADASPPGRRALTQVMAAAAAAFGDLPLVVSTDLAAGITLAPEAAQAVEAALTTLLANVRLHADARNVVVHGDSRGTTWEITVRDDGRGFDPTATTHGYGLRVQVVSSLARHHVTTRIDSVPGDGTTVTLLGETDGKAGGGNRDSGDSGQGRDCEDTRAHEDTKSGQTARTAARGQDLPSDESRTA